jgi:2,3,4,5-tetrahydropyridine-2-carboxylate N-succinyltransferase
MNSHVHSYAFGIATLNRKGEIIEAYYPRPEADIRGSEAKLLIDLLTSAGALEEGYLRLRNKQNHEKELIHEIKPLLNDQAFTEKKDHILDILESENPILTVQIKDVPPKNISQAFLKLHLLSHRLVMPNSINLDGLFGVLRNLAWTNEGAIDIEDLPRKQLEARKQGEVLEINSVDKFPKMANYVVPSGVRIADTSRIRLGAYIGEGTTVMHEGFVNFNAGTKGTAMIEGRISAGVIVGTNSDLGGSSSTMGTLSGGGTELVSVGKNCLIGANAGIGFPLADGCIVEAGLYVTSGTKINLLDESGALVTKVKAKEISDLKNYLFRRNSLSGAVECTPIKNAATLNEELHTHN